MIRRAKEYLRRIIRREHWWAEAWSGLMLASFGVVSLCARPEHLHALPSTRSFMLLMPNGFWQILMVATGALQMATLLADNRWRRGIAAFLAAFFYAWITENQILFSYGLHPVILLSAGWIGVNMFAVSRAIGGLR